MTEKSKARKSKGAEARSADAFVTPARSQVNNFAIKLANVNGTGSSSANGLLVQAIFRMGVPVSGKNLFPSNIQGLPTWYEIRVNGSGYTARALDYDLMVAMNSQTYAEDIAEVRPGATCSTTRPGLSIPTWSATTSTFSGCPWPPCVWRTSRSRVNGS